MGIHFAEVPPEIHVIGGKCGGGFRQLALFFWSNWRFKFSNILIMSYLEFPVRNQFNFLAFELGSLPFFRR